MDCAFSCALHTALLRSAIHTVIHTLMQGVHSSSEQGHIDLRTGGTGDRIVDLPISGQPALP